MLEPGDILFSKLKESGAPKSIALVISIDRGNLDITHGPWGKSRPASALLLFNNFELVSRDFTWISRNLYKDV